MGEDTGSRDPQEILGFAYNQNKSTGSCTACIATIDENQIRVSNLGDSGFVLLRYIEPLKTESSENNENNNQENFPGAGNGELDIKESGSWVVVHQSKEQQHYFNCPRQLGTNSTDSPLDADQYILDCLPGDLIVMATDGMYDNVSPEEVCDILSNLDFKTEIDDVCNDIDEVLGKTAHVLALEASEAQADRERMTPFAVSARAHGFNFAGGKPDDITIVVSLVQKETVTTISPKPETSINDENNHQTANVENMLMSMSVRTPGSTKKRLYAGSRRSRLHSTPDSTMSSPSRFDNEPNTPHHSTDDDDDDTLYF